MRRFFSDAGGGLSEEDVALTRLPRARLLNAKEEEADRVFDSLRVKDTARLDPMTAPSSFANVEGRRGRGSETILLAGGKTSDSALVAEISSLRSLRRSPLRTEASGLRLPLGIWSWDSTGASCGWLGDKGGWK